MSIIVTLQSPQPPPEYLQYGSWRIVKTDGSWDSGPQPLTSKITIPSGGGVSIHLNYIDGSGYSSLSFQVTDAHTYTYQVYDGALEVVKMIDTTGGGGGVGGISTQTWWLIGGGMVLLAVILYAGGKK